MPGPVSDSYKGPPSASPDFRQNWIEQMRREGFKFFVLKAEDVLNGMDLEELLDFNDILQRYNDRRADVGKSVNSYFVVNRDEPYADEVRRLIEKHEGVQLVDTAASGEKGGGDE